MSDKATMFKEIVDKEWMKSTAHILDDTVVEVRTKHAITSEAINQAKSIGWELDSIQYSENSTKIFFCLQ